MRILGGMTPSEALGTGLAILSVVLIPLMVLLIRGAIKWTRVEGKLDAAVTALEKLVEDKDRVHAELVAQMREDRKATDERLRFLERQRSRRWPRTA